MHIDTGRTRSLPEEQGGCHPAGRTSVSQGKAREVKVIKVIGNWYITNAEMNLLIVVFLMMLWGALVYATTRLLDLLGAGTVSEIGAFPMAAVMYPRRETALARKKPDQAATHNVEARSGFSVFKTY